MSEVRAHGGSIGAVGLFQRPLVIQGDSAAMEPVMAASITATSARVSMEP